MYPNLFPVTLLSFLLIATSGYSQSERPVSKYLDVTFGVARQQGAISFSYVNNWKFGSQKKWGVGVGGRFTTYFASNQYYATAPAQLTSGSTSPLIIFQYNITANIDTVSIHSAQVNLINASIHIDYSFTKRILLGFNIDAIGFSFGGSRSGTYLNGTLTATTLASPTPFNVLLISDNDRGSLNSEFYCKYFLTDKWAIKLGAQFLFTEYTTSTNVQQFPEPNDRFRNKSILVCIGMSYRF